MQLDKRPVAPSILLRIIRKGSSSRTNLVEHGHGLGVKRMLRYARYVLNSKIMFFIEIGCEHLT